MTGIVGALASTAVSSLGMTSVSGTLNGSALQFKSNGHIECDDVWLGTADTWGINVNGSNYEVRATLSSGSLSSGTTGSWVSLASEQEWIRSTTTATLSFQVRDKWTTSVVAGPRSITVSA